MRKDLLQIVCCPEDKAKLFLEGEKLDEHGDVVAGTLRCIQCGFGYPVEDGIPNLLPPQYHVKPAKGTAAKGAAAKSAAAQGARNAGDADQATARAANQDAGQGEVTEGTHDEAVADAATPADE